MKSPQREELETQLIRKEAELFVRRYGDFLNADRLEKEFTALLQLTATQTQKDTITRVQTAIPTIQNHPIVSDPDVHEVAQMQYDQGWNDLHWQVKQVLTKELENL